MDLADQNASLGIEGHRDRVHHVRLAGNQLDAKSLFHLKQSPAFLRSQRRRSVRGKFDLARSPGQTRPKPHSKSPMTQ